jgi:transcriptional regulator with XRE-family HTH domain
MGRRPRKTFDQYLSESFEHDPSLVAEYKETRDELKLAMRLAEVRHESGMSQRDLAERTGIAQPVISRVERGAEVPTLATLLRLASALNVRVVIAPTGVTVEPVIPVVPVELPPQQPILNAQSYFDNPAVSMSMRTVRGAWSTVHIHSGGVEGLLGSGIQSYRDYILQDNPASGLIARYGLGSFVTMPRATESGTQAESSSASTDAANLRQPTALAS